MMDDGKDNGSDKDKHTNDDAKASRKRDAQKRGRGEEVPTLHQKQQCNAASTGFRTMDADPLKKGRVAGVQICPTSDTTPSVRDPSIKRYGNVDIQGFLAASQARPRPVPASSVTAGLLGGLTAGATPGSAAAAPSAPPLPAPGLPPSLMGLYSPSRNTLASLDPARSIPRSAIQSSDVARYLQLQQLQQLQALHIPPRDMRPGFIGFNPGLASILAQLGQPLASSFPHTDTLQALQQQRILALLQQQQERSVIQPLSAVNLQGPPLMAQSLQPSPRSQDPLLMSQMYQPSRPNLPLDLPVLLAQPDDELKLSAHQALLRHQIEAFRANEEDTSTHTRGRNKPIRVGQVGIRCRHCAHLPVSRRQKGSTYFPASLQGCYQAAQNMSTTHMQCGLCTEMPEQIKLEFSRLMATKVASSGAGRPYWAESAKRLGLMDTEDGIRYVRDLPTPADPATT